MTDFDASPGAPARDGASNPDASPSRLRPHLSTLADRLGPRPLTRFAPSPTGHLHLGHIVNALYVWGVARALGGRVLLRMEDHDRVRSRAAFERAILDDLEWLGLNPILVLSRNFAAEPRNRQSDAPDVYETAAAQLAARGLTYTCDCSRRALVRTVEGEGRYCNTCRSAGLEIAPGRGLRLRIDPGSEAFDDALLGAQGQEPAASAATC